MEASAGYKLNLIPYQIEYTIESTLNLQLEWSEWTNEFLGNNALMELLDVEVESNQFYRLNVHVEE